MSRLLVFLGIGVAIGILIAPEKGSVIRQKIADLLDDLGEAGEHLAEKMPEVPAKMSASDI